MMTREHPAHPRGARPAGWLRRVGPMLALLAALVLAAMVDVFSVAAQLVTQPGPDGTPQFDRAVERRTYLSAGPDEILTYLAVVSTEAKALDISLSPEELKSSSLRKRLLD